MIIREYFKNYYNQLTSTEQNIIGILDNDIASLNDFSITAVSKLTNSSTSAISRLVYKLNLDNYQEFKYLLQDISKRETIQVETKILEKEFYNFFEHINYKEIDFVAKLINENKTIYLCAVGQSAIVARYFSEILFKYNLNNIVINESHLLNTLHSRLTDESYVIFISSSGETATLVNAVSSINKKKYSSLLITANSDSKISEYTTKTLVATSPKLDTINQIIDFQSPMFSLIDTILIRYAYLYFEKCK